MPFWEPVNYQPLKTNENYEIVRFRYTCRPLLERPVLPSFGEGNALLFPVN
jgi:hypothetical protein